MASTTDPTPVPERDNGRITFDQVQKALEAALPHLATQSSPVDLESLPVPERDGWVATMLQFMTARGYTIEAPGTSHPSPVSEREQLIFERDEARTERDDAREALAQRKAERTEDAPNPGAAQPSPRPERDVQAEALRAAARAAAEFGQRHAGSTAVAFDGLVDELLFRAAALDG